MSVHAILMSAAVAGLLRRNADEHSASSRADFMASSIAKKADEARNNGGSPIACETSSDVL